MSASSNRIVAGLLAACAASLSILCSTAVAADTNWPNKPLTFVVPFTPGGVTDTTSRILTKLLGERLGQPVIVSNRPGAGGSIGVETVARAAPDGYTLAYGTSGTHAANLALYKNLHYDPVNDFVPVYGLVETPLILVINPDRPFKTVPELIAYAKEHPGKLNFGSAGPGTGTHLTAELFQSAAGIKMTHVPYKGSSPALADLVSGQLDLMFDYPVVVQPFVNAGKLKPLVVTAKSRLSIIPQIPTVGEFGLPAAESSAWSAVFLPAKTPPEIVKKLGDALALVTADPEMKAVREKFGSTPLNLRDADLGAFVKSEMVRWREVVRQSGASLE